MKKIIPVLAALAVISAGCTKEINENRIGSQEHQVLMSKLVGGTAGEIQPGSVLVKLDAETAAKIAGGNSAEAAGSLLEGLSGAAISPAIPVQPKNIEVAKKYGLDRWFTVSFDEEVRPQSAAEILAGSPAVHSVQYQRTVTPVTSENVYPLEEVPATKAAGEEGFPFNDPYASYQWNLHNDGSIAADAKAGADVGVKDAWRLTGGDPSVIVAVLDCGLAFRHEDLAEAMWTNEKEVNGNDGVDDDGNGYVDDIYGYNFASETAKINYKTQTGHGSHVAGIIGAINGNGKGISSVAGGTGNGDGVRLMSCQTFDYDHLTDQVISTNDTQVAAAFIYAADNGACIAQCSYGNHNIITDDETYINGNNDIKGAPLEYAAIKYFTDPANSNHENLKGNIAVFAAGNHKNPYSIYPGALSDVISVTGICYDFLPGGYTNYGPGCKIAAPGGEDRGTNVKTAMILSIGVSGTAYTSPGVETGKKNYVYMQGTSMACPHVSGVLALGISYARKLGKQFTREEMTSMLLTSVNDIDQYLVSGSKNFYDVTTGQSSVIPLDRYRNQLGTGLVDAWKFLMAIEGTPSAIVKSGEKSSIDLSDYCNPFDTYTISIDNASRTSLGITSDPVIRDGRLEIECGKVGAGKIRLEAAVGKDPENDGGIGGMTYSREISIVSREFATNNGGWL